ncbi:MAG: ArsA family ATPase [Actinomycetota bacterium]
MEGPQLIDRRLAFVIGKGGVGKTAVAAALALGLADAGHRTLLVEVGAETRTEALFGVAPSLDDPVEVRPGLFALTVDAELATQEYLSIQLKVKPLVEMMARSRAFHQVTQAAPGLAELVTLGKIWDLATTVRDGAPVWDRLVVDSPATGHGIALLEAAGNARDLAGSGPIKDQAEAIEKVVRHPAATGIAVVATPEDLAVTEAVEAVQALRARSLPVACAVANAVRRSPFSDADAEALRAVLANTAAGDAERAAEQAAIAGAEGARHDDREVDGLARDSALPVAVLPLVPDLAPGSGGLEALSAALMRDPAVRGTP